MCPVNSVFDTGAGRNLLREDMVERDWLSSIPCSEKPRLRCVKNEKMEVVGTLMTHVRMAEAHVRVMIGIFKNMAVSVLFGTSLIDKFEKRIFLAERKIVPYSSQPIQILMV